MDDRLIYEVLSVVEEIPEGRVATYGQIARLIGREKNARLVGKILSRAGFYGDYPCHRVVNHAGRTAPGWAEQAALLEGGGRGAQGKRLRGPEGLSVGPMIVQKSAAGRRLRERSPAFLYPAGKFFR